MSTEIPVPLVLRNLIHANNQLLRDYQNKLQAEVAEANTELMQLLGLTGEWALDVKNMKYIKVQEPNASSNQ